MGRSKNFEEEYRRMTDSEIPDLWDRIEERIDALPSKEEEVPKKPAVRFFNRRRTSAFIMAAAAALCILVARPIYLRHGNAGMGGSMGSMTGPASENFTDHAGVASTQGAAMKGDRAPAAAGEADTVSEAFAFADEMNSIALQKPLEAETAEAPGAPEASTFLAEVRICGAERDARGNMIYEAEIIRSEDGGPEKGTPLRFRFATGEEPGEPEPESSLSPGQRGLLCLYGSGEAAEDGDTDMFPEICIVYWLAEDDF